MDSPKNVRYRTVVDEDSDDEDGSVVSQPKRTRTEYHLVASPPSARSSIGDISTLSRSASPVPVSLYGASPKTPIRTPPSSPVDFEEAPVLRSSCVPAVAQVLTKPIPILATASTSTSMAPVNHFLELHESVSAHAQLERLRSGCRYGIVPGLVPDYELATDLQQSNTPSIVVRKPSEVPAEDIDDELDSEVELLTKKMKEASLCSQETILRQSNIPWNRIPTMASLNSNMELHPLEELSGESSGESINTSTLSTMVRFRVRVKACDSNSVQFKI